MTVWRWKWNPWKSNPASRRWTRGVSVPEPLETRQLLVVNGTVTNLFAAVGLFGRHFDNDCSAILIAPDWVLTAAHCVTGMDDNDARFTVGGMTYQSDAVFQHPDYRRNKLGSDKANDLALVHLATPVNNVTPLEIFRGTPVLGESLTLVGFGAGGDESGHNGDFGIKRVGTTPLDKLKTTLLRWKFDVVGEANTAPGDSGGPALVDRGGTWYVAGVTSGGSKRKAGFRDRSFDTRVDAYAGWIDEVQASFTGAAVPLATTVAEVSARTSKAVLFPNQSRIVNGTPTNDFPAVGMVGDQRWDSASGVLIDNEWVVTAGHVGKGVGHKQGRFTIAGVTYKTRRIFVHPQYNANQLGTDSAHDIALYQLKKAVAGVTPITRAVSAPTVGISLSLVGFGWGGDEHQIDASYGTKRVGMTELETVTSTLLKWDFDDPEESGVAPGDSGGAAFVAVDGGSYELVGITSGAASNLFTLGASLFDTRVDAYAEWIDSLIERHDRRG